MLAASETFSSRRTLSGYKLIVFLTAMLAAYSVMVGWGLLAGFVPYQRGYLLIALACLIPLAGYAYGFIVVKDSVQDWGLLLSAVGWAFVFIALLVQHSALQAQLAAIKDLPFGVVPGGLETGALLCLIVAVAFIFGGGALSLIAWNSERQALVTAESEAQLHDRVQRGGL